MPIKEDRINKKIRNPNNDLIMKAKENVININRDVIGCLTFP